MDPVDFLLLPGFILGLCTSGLDRKWTLFLVKNVGNNEKHFDFTLSALAGFEAIGQANGPSAFPFVADKLLIAHSFVGFDLRKWTSWRRTIAETFFPAN